MNDSNEFDCNLVKEFKICTSASYGSTTMDTKTKFTLRKEAKQGENGCSFVSGTFKLNKKTSEVYKKKPDEDSGEWIKICHYSNFYLRFNKNKYETNVPESTNISITDTLIKNEYTCPNFLCKYKISYNNYGDEYYYFSDKSSSDCIAGSNFSGDEFKCGALQNYMDEFDDANNKYFENNNVKDLEDRNKSVEKIKSFCKSITENGNYTDANRCTKECININDKITDRLGIKLSNGECGLSGNLIKWIKNILKWIKYILPVLVIILGIIDFIKAIASGSDDEMKKAQGRFIKRLIAAALLFLIPALIEFILNIFNIESAFCGVI